MKALSFTPVFKPGITGKYHPIVRAGILFQKTTFPSDGINEKMK